MFSILFNWKWCAAMIRFTKKNMHSIKYDVFTIRMQLVRKWLSFDFERNISRINCMCVCVCHVLLSFPFHISRMF